MVWVKGSQLQWEMVMQGLRSQGPRPPLPQQGRPPRRPAAAAAGAYLHMHACIE